ncbi:zinc transporter ZIP6-like [Saccostrea echinata]|uniref:zinc transporter ZIP6-like n=1 Tax=Saccostrea echinata TaxID=191078 RepID=UPI002A83A389|nr:zinc transporter ZIP6-like [Saccostrea echinata]
MGMTIFVFAVVISVICLEEIGGDIQNMSAIEKMFIKHIFQKYGNESMLSFEGFEHLYQNLEIGDIQITHPLNEHFQHADFVSLHSDHKHQPKRNRILRRKHKHRRHQDIFSKCLFPVDMMKLFGFSTLDVITADQFHHMCPVIMAQVDGVACPLAHVQHHKLLTDSHGMEGLIKIPPEAWGYGSASIITISLLGLLAVSFIPCLQRVFLNTVLQFLVSLAVGALSGDAMLHLIPHAFTGEKEDSDEGRGEVYKGLCGLAGIYCFFIIGRLQGIYMNRKIKEQDRDSKENYLDITLNIISKDEETSESVDLKPVDDKDTTGQKQIKMDEHSHLHEHKHSHEQEHSHEYEHSKGHGHSHDQPVPQDMGGLVWRVIIGDGIHNFSDGIAVGVAFATSITGGLSTSVAILCHELPHEMGDFAVLLKNGMTIKKAVLCNCLSSLLSFIGMAVGLAVGNIGDSSPWIFLGIAGMFLYISLVDLLPEMSLLDSENKDKRPFRQFFFQLGGAGIGIGIMFLIALYEHQLNSLFNE